MFYCVFPTNEGLVIIRILDVLPFEPIASLRSHGHFFISIMVENMRIFCLNNVYTSDGKYQCVP